MLHIVMFLSEPCSVFLRTFLPHFLAVMKKDLLKIKKHSSDLFLKRNQTNPKDVKLHNDVEVSLSLSSHGAIQQGRCVLMGLIILPG